MALGSLPKGELKGVKRKKGPGRKSERGRDLRLPISSAISELPEGCVRIEPLMEGEGRDWKRGRRGGNTQLFLSDVQIILSP